MTVQAGDVPAVVFAGAYCISRASNGNTVRNAITRTETARLRSETLIPAV